MGILNKLKPQKIVDTIFSGIDKGILSKEEIVDYSVKAAEANLEFIKATQTESTPRARTRRIIAIMVLAQYFLAFNAGLVGIITKLYNGEEIISLATEAFAKLAIAVVIFYFGNHLLTTIMPKLGIKRK